MDLSKAKLRRRNALICCGQLLARMGTSSASGHIEVFVNGGHVTQVAAEYPIVNTEDLALPEPALTKAQLESIRRLNEVLIRLGESASNCRLILQVLNGLPRELVYKMWFNIADIESSDAEDHRHDH